MRFSQRIDGTIDDIQLGWMPLPFTESAKRIEGGLGHLIVKRHNDNARLLKQFVEKADSFRP